MIRNELLLLFFLSSWTSGMTRPLPCEGGFYCPSGSANQRPCPAGSYGNMSGLVEERQCSPCDPGMFCKETGTMHPLPWHLSPVMYFSQISISWTAAVLPRHNYYSIVAVLLVWLKSLLAWCLFKGRRFPSGPCAAGFVCAGKASEASPSDGLTGFPCPAGFYCSVGTSVPKPCPKGTFRCMSCISIHRYLHSLSALLGTPD